MTPCYCYLRVSGNGQTAADKDGFPRQQRAVEKYAADHEYQIVKIFREEGIPGAMELEGRPALRELVSSSQQENGPKLVLIERLDRLARDLMIQETIMGDFRRRGIEIVSTLEPDINSSDPTRTFIRQVFGALAQYDKAMLVVKLRASREAKRRAKGRCEGAKPYGEHPAFPDEILGVEEIKKLRERGDTYREIAENMQRHGFKVRRGLRGWNPGTVYRVLKRANAL
jgi:DNA invertase Pin-like site-specific DNA recombinase